MVNSSFTLRHSGNALEMARISDWVTLNVRVLSMLSGRPQKFQPPKKVPWKAAREPAVGSSSNNEVISTSVGSTVFPWIVPWSNAGTPALFDTTNTSSTPPEMTLEM